MDLTTFNRPAVLWKQGEETFVINNPSKLKVQVTGTDAQTLLEVGPESGKIWTIMVRVEVQESE